MYTLLQLSPSVSCEALTTLCASLPPPIADTPEARASRDEAAMDAIAALRPTALGRLAITAAAVLTVAAWPSLANPPSPNSTAAQTLAPYADAIRGLTQPGSGRSCCDLSDCRMVDVRIGNNGRYEALISPYDSKTGDGFPGGPGRYLEVPPEVVVPPEKRNELPISVACWANWSRQTNGFLCLSPGPGG